MTRRLGLRVRLTFAMTLIFAVALVLSTAVALREVEERLIDDARSTAESLLTSHLNSIYGGVAAVGVVDANERTRFFYLDDTGRELSIDEYFQTFTGDLDVISSIDGSHQIAPGDPILGGVVGGEISAAPDSALPLDLAIDPDTGELVLPDGGRIAVVIGPTPQGQPRPIDRGDDVVAVAQTLLFSDGATLDVGVSSPLRPVTDSLDTIRGLLWVAVPILVTAIALVSWIVIGRALRPVRAISDRAKAITADNISDRVPTPEARDEIHNLASTVNEMLDRLERSHRQQRQFVADASHELRSPVAASRAQLEVARRAPSATDWSHTVNVVLAEQERLSALIDDLLALTRIDEAGVANRAQVDLDELVLAETARHPDIVTGAILRPARVVGDTTLLVRAVRNLIDNAVRHAQTTVTVTLDSDVMCATIRVDDDGPGIPEEDRETIFGRFTRLNEARTDDEGGAGLGLAIARDVARAHGGDVTVSDSPLGGAAFILTLPTV